MYFCLMLRYELKSLLGFCLKPHHLSNRMKSNVDPIELTYFLTNQSNNVKRMVNQPDHHNVTPLHMAASIGAGFCCVHLVDVRLTFVNI